MHGWVVQSRMLLTRCSCSDPGGLHDTLPAIRYIVYNSVTGNPADTDFPLEDPTVRSVVAQQWQTFPN